MGTCKLRLVIKKTPKVSASRIPVASRVVNRTRDELRPAVNKKVYQLLPEMSASCVSFASRVVNRMQEEMATQSVKQREGFYTVLFYVMLYKLYAHIQNCRMTSTVH